MVAAPVDNLSSEYQEIADTERGSATPSSACQPRQQNCRPLSDGGIIWIHLILQTSSTLLSATSFWLTALHLIGNRSDFFKFLVSLHCRFYKYATLWKAEEAYQCSREQLNYWHKVLKTLEKCSHFLFYIFTKLPKLAFRVLFYAIWQRTTRLGSAITKTRHDKVPPLQKNRKKHRDKQRSEHWIRRQFLLWWDFVMEGLCHGG